MTNFVSTIFSRSISRRLSSYLIAIAAAAVLVTGCADLVLRPIDKEDRDQSGQFDGTYTVKQHKGPLKQNIEQWVFTCRSLKRERQFTMIVRDGQITINGSGGRPDITYVDASGDFRAEFALGGTAKESARSFVSITRGKLTLIMQGNISGKSPSGLITWGIEQFGNTGCSTRLSFKKQ